MDSELRARLFRNDAEAWNDERYVLVGAPALGIAGVVLGAAIGFTLGLPIAYRLLVYAVCAGLTVAIGLPVLAMVDLQSRREG